MCFMHFGQKLQKSKIRTFAPLLTLSDNLYKLMQKRILSAISRLLFIMVQLLLTTVLNGQNTSYGERKIFFGVKEDEDLSDQKIYEKVAVGDQIIAFRKLNPPSFTIAEEYIQYQKDTFLYRAYADTAHHVLAEGLVIFTHEDVLNDTVVIFDPETYEEVFTVTRYRHPWRSGFWRIETSDVFESGHYKNNVKTGEWFVREKQGFQGNTSITMMPGVKYPKSRKTC